LGKTSFLVNPFFLWENDSLFFSDSYCDFCCCYDLSFVKGMVTFPSLESDSSIEIDFPSFVMEILRSSMIEKKISSVKILNETSIESEKKISHEVTSSKVEI